MPIFRKIFLFGGWVPALAGGGVTVWWLESDKTVEDVLKKTGRGILWNKRDFQNIYDSFKDDENFIKCWPTKLVDFI